MPSLDLDPQRTKLQLLVPPDRGLREGPGERGGEGKALRGEELLRDAGEGRARSNFSDAKSQTERWMQAVILPLEVQIKDHKAQLQSRLDNLSKINEKTTSINEQMAIAQGREADLRAPARDDRGPDRARLRARGHRPRSTGDTAPATVHAARPGGGARR